MAKTVVGLFDTFAEAQRVVQSLIDTGVDRGDISLVANDARGEYASYTQETGVDTSTAAESAGAGAVGGSVIGGVLGLLVGVGALAIPGIGPVIAAGSLATTLGSTALGAGIGAAAGGLVGALVGAGVPEDDANVYTEGVRRGGTLVTVNASDDLADSVYAVMSQHGAVDIKERGTSYRESGWDRFNPDADPYDAGSDWERSSKVGTAGGTAAGAATGAAIGSAAGPVGTVVGGLAGAAVGAGVGAAGDVAGRKADDQDGDAGELDDPSRRGSMSGRSDVSDASIIDDRTTPGNMGSDWERSSKAGTATGTAAGAAAGAAIGSVAGPVGTVAGGLAGAAVGAGAGAAGDAAGRYADDQDGDAGELDDPNRRRGMSPSDTTPNSTMPIQDENVNAGTRMGSADDPSARVYASDAGDDWERSSKVGTAGGTAAGAATGAAMGSVAGPVGTVVGGLAGAAVGAGVGAAGDVAGRKADDQDGDAGELDDPSRPSSRATQGTIADANNTSGLIPADAGPDMDRTDMQGMGDSSLTGARDVSDTYKSEVQQDWEQSGKIGSGADAASGTASGAAIGAVGGPVGEEATRQREIGGGRDFDSYDSDFRTHYQDNFATSGYSYDQYNQVYRYGYSLGSDQRYRSSEWDVIEREANRAWEERNPGTWDQFKGAIQYAWAKARGHLS